MPQEGKQGGGPTVLLWLFLLSTVPSAFPNWPYCSWVQERASPCAVWVTGGTGFVRFGFCFLFFYPHFCFGFGVVPPPLLCLPRTAVGCVLCVLCITGTVLLGHLSCWDPQLPTLHPLSFLQIWLDKGRRYKRRPVLFWKGQSWGGKAACRDFQLLNQNSEMWVLLSFMH